MRLFFHCRVINLQPNQLDMDMGTKPLSAPDAHCRFVKCAPRRLFSCMTTRNAATPPSPWNVEATHLWRRANVPTH